LLFFFQNHLLRPKAQRILAIRDKENILRSSIHYFAVCTFLLTVGLFGLQKMGFEAFYFEVLNLRKTLLSSLRRVHTICSTNKIKWKDAALVAMKSFSDLQEGIWLFSAHHQQDVFVDGDIFTIPVDNKEADKWYSTCSSCVLFCRCCQVLSYFISMSLTWLTSCFSF
jgi:hypothetical protein